MPCKVPDALSRPGLRWSCLHHQHERFSFLADAWVPRSCCQPLDVRDACARVGSVSEAPSRSASRAHPRTSPASHSLAHVDRAAPRRPSRRRSDRAEPEATVAARVSRDSQQLVGLCAASPEALRLASAPRGSSGRARELHRRRAGPPRFRAW
jgi:hypothetical protein